MATNHPKPTWLRVLFWTVVAILVIGAVITLIAVTGHSSQH